MSDKSSEEKTTISPSLEVFRKNKKLKPFEVRTEGPGGLGPSKSQTRVSSWRPVRYEDKVEVHFFIPESYITQGLVRDPMMPWQVPLNHAVYARRVGVAITGRQRFGRMRYYGSWTVDGDDKNLVYVAAVRDSEGNELHRPFAEREDIDLWVRLSSIQGASRALKLVDVWEYSPRSAAKHLIDAGGDDEDRITPSGVIEMSRENGLKQRHILAVLLRDIARGEAALKALNRIKLPSTQRGRSYKTIFGEKAVPPKI